MGACNTCQEQKEIGTDPYNSDTTNKTPTITPRGSKGTNLLDQEESLDIIKEHTIKSEVTSQMRSP